MALDELCLPVCWVRLLPGNSLTVILFKLIFVASLLHLYVGMRLVPALDSPVGLLFGLYLGVSSLLIPLALLSRPMPAPRRERLAWAGFLLMGVFSSLWVLTVLRDLLLIAAGGASLLGPLQAMQAGGVTPIGTSAVGSNTSEMRACATTRPGCGATIRKTTSSTMRGIAI